LNYGAGIRSAKVCYFFIITNDRVLGTDKRLSTHDARKKRNLVSCVVRRASLFANSIQIFLSPQYHRIPDKRRCSPDPRIHKILCNNLVLPSCFYSNNISLSGKEPYITVYIYR